MAITLDGTAGITTPDLTDTSLTSGRVVYAGTSGNLTGSSGLTFNGTSLGVGSSSYGDAGTISLSVGVAGTTSGGLQMWASSAQEHYIQWGDSTSGSATYAGAISYAHATDSMRFWTGSTERMRIDSSGQLLLGTTSNLATSRRELVMVGTNGAVVSLGNTITADRFQIVSDSSENALLINKSNTPMIFYTNNSQRMRITEDGNLLVGTTSQITNEKLSIDTGNTVGIGIKTTGGASNSPIFSWNATTTGDGFFAAFATETSLTVRGSITYNRAAGLVSYNTTSDYRAKDITGLVTGSGALIDSIPVYMGKMKGATQERPMFIAHETPAYAHTGEKDAVDADGKPVYQQMDASALIPVMWAEIQSLRKRLAALESA